jgi:hypothetical protein
VRFDHHRRPDSKAAFTSATVDERLGGTASTASNRLIFRRNQPATTSSTGG